MEIIIKPLFMKHFTLNTRIMLADLLEKKTSYRKISRVIQKSISSISDEIERNSIHNKYDPYEAHRIASLRELEKGKRTKLELNPQLMNNVIDKLKDDWSPEEIAGEFKSKTNGINIISHETIYQLIYSPEGIKLKLWKHLRHRKKPKRVSFGTRKCRKINIPNRVSINERSNAINLRLEFGHWEGDLMLFSKISLVLAVFVERMTRRVIVVLSQDKTAEEMKLALHELIGNAGQINVKSITFDNGGENVCHQEIRELYDEENLKTYFCDPYKSWQKGTVENTNKLLRQYFPRSINPELLTQDYVDEVATKLNNRPRKCLNYITPKNQFALCSV